uniref:YceI family protein n=1 Tax=Caldilinea aerophila TaxID=133453 RepID=A0A7C1FD90_9CHLR
MANCSLSSADALHEWSALHRESILKSKEKQNGHRGVKEVMRKRSIGVLLGIMVMILSGVLMAACQGGSSPTPTSSAMSATATAAETQPAAEGAASGANTPEPAEESTVAEEATPAEQSATESATETQASEASPEANSAPITLRFVREGTEARFLIDEVLMGQPKTVVGVTSLVEGEITVNPADPTSVQVGEIRIDARDLTTDDNRRNNRLRNDILKSTQDAYRYIVFRPTSIEGLPSTVNVGDTFNFQVTGDLTILDTTLPVTFDMNVTVVDANTVRGSGSATVRHADFGIRIPSVPIVAGVSDEVRLEIDFTAQG